MYAKPAEIEKYLKSSPKKPYISCEYSHSMGNSTGNLSLYTQLEDKYQKYQGGFIWDYIDQFCMKDGKLVYGGDFEDRPSDYEFCGDGIVFANRQPSPKVQEVKQLYSNVKIDIKDGIVTVKNQNLFIDTSKYKFVASILRNGKTEWSEKFNWNVPACSSMDFDIFPKLNKDFDEIVYLVEMFENDNSLCFGQECIGWNSYVINNYDAPKVVNGDVNIGVYGKDFKILFSKSEGGLASLVYGDKEFITRSPKTSFWRALTDNDRGCKHCFDRAL